MEQTMMKALIEVGAFAAIGITAIGSSWGCAVAGCSAVGAWKKCYVQNKFAPFQLVVFTGAPLSQTIYGMILMFIFDGKSQDPKYAPYWLVFLCMGILAGIGMGICAWLQGKAAAGCCDSFAETGKGFVNNLLVLGIIETVAIFIMAFSMILIFSMKV